MYEIRKVEEKDLEILAGIMVEVFTMADPSKPWSKDGAQKYLEYWFEKQPDMFFVAYNEEKSPIGAVATNIKPWRTSVRCTDGVVFVSAHHQKKGVASMLLKTVLGEAMQKYGVSEIEAITFAGEEFPLGWYKKLGLTPDSHAVIIKGKCHEILNNLG